jgi:Domain of unknown function (DUF4266)
MQKRLVLVLMGTLGSILLMGCAVVKPYEREKLADPIMEVGGEFSKQTLEQKFFLTQEGSAGGPSGIGGGCGCSK